MSTLKPQKTIVVLSTVGSEQDALCIGKTLVEEKLAACVNVVPNVRSLYTWKGKLCDEQEWLLIAKTWGSLFDVLKTRILELHPYELPEVICIPIADGHGPYLDWIVESTAGASKKGDG